MCKVGGVSRSGYYKWVKRQSVVTQRDKDDQKAEQLIKKAYDKNNGIYGYRRIKTWIYRKYKINYNHKKVYRHMKKMGLKSRIRKRKKYYPKKINPIVCGNILNRNFNAKKPNKKWVTDITYLQFNNQTLYLSVIKDLFNNEIIAYNLSSKGDVNLVLDTVKKAAKKRNVQGPLIHSDRGSLYTSKKYHQLIQSYNMKVSMSRAGDCFDNASIESFFSHLKCEMMYLQNFETKEEVKEAVDEYIYFYNHERFQENLKQMTPVEYRSHFKVS